MASECSTSQGVVSPAARWRKQSSLPPNINTFSPSKNFCPDSSTSVAAPPPPPLPPPYGDQWSGSTGTLGAAASPLLLSRLRKRVVLYLEPPPRGKLNPKHGRRQERL
ncbi:unnamed protein product [Pleuronectes platessa]|uniref:Uncharacterized protein n=1 Tax=Pleuronectes platessa TaxID=8262 RepID=A0A9N7VXV8_PLEPL|nr:unnamed protein product [Pleuronectes platessa]